jgi:hypothetical protein
MAAVAFGGVQRYAAVRLKPLVVVRWAAEGGEKMEMAFIRYIVLTYLIFNFAFFCQEELGTAGYRANFTSLKRGLTGNCELKINLI